MPAIVTRERGEAAPIGADLARLRTRTTARLVLAASGSALLCPVELIVANRRLADEVADKTAQLATIGRCGVRWSTTIRLRSAGASSTCSSGTSLPMGGRIAKGLGRRGVDRQCRN